MAAVALDDKQALSAHRTSVCQNVTQPVVAGAINKHALARSHSPMRTTHALAHHAGAAQHKRLDRLRQPVAVICSACTIAGRVCVCV